MSSLPHTSKIYVISVSISPFFITFFLYCSSYNILFLVHMVITSPLCIFFLLLYIIVLFFLFSIPFLLHSTFFLLLIYLLLASTSLFFFSSYRVICFTCHFLSVSIKPSLPQSFIPLVINLFFLSIHFLSYSSFSFFHQLKFFPLSHSFFFFSSVIQLFLFSSFPLFFCPAQSFFL